MKTVVKTGRALALLVGILLLMSQSIAAAQITPRIVGGTVVPDNRYPFMVSIYFNPDGDIFFDPGCGGALVSSRWVLTAAHCLLDRDTGAQLPVDEVAVLVGALNLADDNDGELISASRLIVHPGYSTIDLKSDIALIELSQEVNLAPLALPANGSEIPAIGEFAVVAGWGRTVEGGPSSNQLRAVSLPVLSHPDCLPFYRQTLDLDANLCAGGTRGGGRDSCQGDSGSPLFVEREGRWVQAGIVSYGEGCARPGIPGVYTRVASYFDWVNSFVPDLQVVGDAAATSTGGQNVDGILLSQLNGDTAMLSGSLLTGEVAVYEVRDAIGVELNSISGDANLFIFVGTNFEEDDIVCVSDNSTALDTCDLPATPDRVFAGVYSYESSNYEIRIISPFVTTGNGNPAGGNTQGNTGDTTTLPVNDGNGVPAQAGVPTNDGELATLSRDSGAGLTGWLALLVLLLANYTRRRY